MHPSASSVSKKSLIDELEFKNLHQVGIIENFKVIENHTKNHKNVALQ
jgi:hypothetical protein